MDRPDSDPAAPSREQFAQQVIDEFRQAGETRRALFDPDEFRLIIGESGGEVVNLQNFYDEHCALPDSGRKKHLAHIVRGLVTGRMELPDEFDDARPDLRPKIWLRAGLEKMRLESRCRGEEFTDLPLAPLGNHLAAGLVYDLPTCMRSISQEELDAWNVTWDEAMHVARTNLIDDGIAFASVGDGLYASVLGDNYDASRLLLPAVISQLKLEGLPVAMVPNRDTLLVTGSEDATGLSMMLELAEKALQDPRPMSPLPLILAGDDWRDWMPPEDHPQFQRWRMLGMQFLGSEYAEQKDLLDAVHLQEGLDVFVAAFSGLQADGGAVFSYCVWSEGVDSLLPETDKIFFFRRNEDTIAGADWRRVRRVVGDLMVPDRTLYPVRYRVREFPSQALLHEIGLDVIRKQ